MLELKELSEKTLEIFKIDSIDNLGKALMECVDNNDMDKIVAFNELVDDLSIDWLQKIYQYYCADRKDKKQDYTPKCLAQFVSRLIGDSEKTVDMCAGSGALTIQRWIECPETTFELYEIDENVIPYLLFNLVLRNIKATVYQGDILQGEIVRTWQVRNGARYGEVISI